ncbi:MAG: hypothetical protein L0Y56_13525, partial [Nitrospira sp.]|nr:hypothetical protein [Nitrospira sp.]
RFYAPTQGRFISKDTWPGDQRRPLTLNGWNYTEANPVNRVDPTGHQSTGTGTGIGKCPPETIQVPWIHIGPFGAEVVDYKCIKLPFGPKPPSSDSQTQGYCGRIHMERQKEDDEEEEDEFCKDQRRRYEAMISRALILNINIMELTFQWERSRDPEERQRIETALIQLNIDLDNLLKEAAEKRSYATWLGCNTSKWPDPPPRGGDAPMPVPIPVA